MPLGRNHVQLRSLCGVGVRVSTSSLRPISWSCWFSLSLGCVCCVVCVGCLLMSLLAVVVSLHPFHVNWKKTRARASYRSDIVIWRGMGHLWELGAPVGNGAPAGLDHLGSRVPYRSNVVIGQRRNSPCMERGRNRAAKSEAGGGGKRRKLRWSCPHGSLSTHCRLLLQLAPRRALAAPSRGGST